MEKLPTLDQIVAEIKASTSSPLSKTATQAVPGEGNPHADIMFVGEAPGFNEDKQGRPFVGAAGKFLDSMLASIGLERTDVYITNVVKYRPPENRDPMPNEIAADFRFLKLQIAVIDPKIIVTLGRFSMAALLPDLGKISEIHGKAYRRPDGRVYVPFFHPAAGLHQASLKATIENDFKKLPKIIALVDNAS
jgi:DNA polymerase